MLLPLCGVQWRPRSAPLCSAALGPSLGKVRTGAACRCFLPILTHPSIQPVMYAFIHSHTRSHILQISTLHIYTLTTSLTPCFVHSFQTYKQNTYQSTFFPTLIAPHTIFSCLLLFFSTLVPLYSLSPVSSPQQETKH